jgi:hypothetical protein
VRFILATICVLAALSEAQGQQAGMMGAGSGTCAAYTQAYRDDPDTANNLYFGWAQGYMSGQNVTRGDKPMRNLNAIPVSAQLIFLKRFCEQRPTDFFAVAAQNLFNALPSITR